MFSDSDGERLKLEWETMRTDSHLIIIINIIIIIITALFSDSDGVRLEL